MFWIDKPSVAYKCLTDLSSPLTAKPSDSVINTEENKIFIGVGLVALLVTVDGVGIMCYKKYGKMSSMIYDDIWMIFGEIVALIYTLEVRDFICR